METKYVMISKQQLLRLIKTGETNPLNQYNSMGEVSLKVIVKIKPKHFRDTEFNKLSKEDIISLL